MKLILRLALLAIVLVVVGLFVLVGNIDRVAKTAIEGGATYATGVNVTTQSVGLSLLGGQLNVNNLNIPNPTGYKTPHMLNMGNFQVALSLPSLTTDTVVVPILALENLDLYIEEQADGSNNVSAILANVQKVAGPSDPSKPSEPADTSSSKKVKVDTLILRNITAHVHPRGIASVAGPISVTIPEIKLEGVTPDNAQGLAISELYERILPIIISAVVQKGAGLIPADLSNTLTKDVGKVVEQLGAEAGKLAQQLTTEMDKTLKDAAAKATEAVGKVVNEETGKAVGEAAGKLGEDLNKNVGGALQNILGQPKK
jgi:hypothetical protein